MKNLILILVLFCAAACTKEGAEVLPEHEMYTLQFEVEDETPSDRYLIQVSKDGRTYQTVDVLSYNAAANGLYTYQLEIDANTTVRVASGEASDPVYSPIVIAK